MSRTFNLDGALAARAFNTPLLIEPNKAQTISNYLINRAGYKMLVRGEEFMAEDYDEADETQPYEAGGVAIIPITGTLVHRGDWMSAESGMISYKWLRGQLLAAAKDESIAAILLDIDSPGGEVEGNFDLANLIAQIDKEVKPVYAIANGSAYSGAFSLGVAARQFYVTQTGGVGSVGVIVQHVDFSKMNEQRGITVTNITYGDKKAEFSEDFPLSKEAKATLQERVNTLGEIFVNHVASMRGISAQSVIDTQAGLLFGDEGLKIGFVDGISSFEDLLENLIVSASSASVPQLNQGKNNMFGKKEKIEGGKPEENQPEATAPEEQGASDKPASAAEPAPAAPAVEQETITVDQAAEIADLCTKAGMGAKAGSFIKSGLSFEQIKSKINSATQIKQLCKLAGKGETVAADYISAGKSVEEVQSELLAGIEAEESEADVSNKQKPEQVEGDFAEAGNVLVADAQKRVDAAKVKA